MLTETERASLAADLRSVEAAVGHAEAGHNEHALTALYVAKKYAYEIERLNGQLLKGHEQCEAEQRAHHTAEEWERLETGLAEVKRERDTAREVAKSNKRHVEAIATEWERVEPVIEAAKAWRKAVREAGTVYRLEGPAGELLAAIDTLAALESTADAPEQTPGGCQRCKRPFDPGDTRFDGQARSGSTPWCRSCVDRCHESSDAFHACPICAASTSDSDGGGQL